jgi:hypothetical protein
MNFDPWNHSLKIQKFIETPTLKMKAHLQMCEFIPKNTKCDSWTSFLIYKPKVKVVTFICFVNHDLSILMCFITHEFGILVTINYV